MQLQEVRVQVKRIEDMVSDPEAAHSLEDGLYLKVLQEIADTGDRRSASFAREALQASHLDFPRWAA